MEYIIFGLIFGLISMIVAEGKGRSRGGWFAAGFFFGIFGLLVLAFLPKVEAPTEAGE